MTTSRFHAKQTKHEYWKNKSASEIEKEIIREDIWEAVEHAQSHEEFYHHLRALGYYINRNHKYDHISVTPPGWNKTVRIDTLIPELDKCGLAEMIVNNYERYCSPIYFDFEYFPLKKYSGVIWNYKYRKNNVPDFIEVIFALIRLAMGLDNCRNKDPRSVVTLPSFRKESAVLREHQSIIRFVSKHQIKTPQDIRDAMIECQAKMDDLKEQRDILYNRIRRPKETDAVAELKAARDSLTRDIAEAREQLKTATKLTDLLKRMEKDIDEELELERNDLALPEPPTADPDSRYINSKDYDPDRHYPPHEDQRERKRGGWGR